MASTEQKVDGPVDVTAAKQALLLQQAAQQQQQSKADTNNDTSSDDESEYSSSSSEASESDDGESVASQQQLPQQQQQKKQAPHAKQSAGSASPPPVAHLVAAAVKPPSAPLAGTKRSRDTAPEAGLITAATASKILKPYNPNTLLKAEAEDDEDDDEDGSSSYDDDDDDDARGADVTRVATEDAEDEVEGEDEKSLTERLLRSEYPFRFRVGFVNFGRMVRWMKTLSVQTPYALIRPYAERDWSGLRAEARQGSHIALVSSFKTRVVAGVDDKGKRTHNSEVQDFEFILQTVQSHKLFKGAHVPDRRVTMTYYTAGPYQHQLMLESCNNAGDADRAIPIPIDSLEHVPEDQRDEMGKLLDMVFSYPAQFDIDVGVMITLCQTASSFQGKNLTVRLLDAVDPDDPTVSHCRLELECDSTPSMRDRLHTSSKQTKGRDDSGKLVTKWTKVNRIGTQWNKLKWTQRSCSEYHMKVLLNFLRHCGTNNCTIELDPEAATQVLVLKADTGDHTGHYFLLSPKVEDE